MTTDELIDQLAFQAVNYAHFSGLAVNEGYMPTDMQAKLFQQNAELLALALGEITFNEGWTKEETDALLKRKHSAMVRETEKIEKQFAQQGKPS